MDTQKQKISTEDDYREFHSDFDEPTIVADHPSKHPHKSNASHTKHAPNLQQPDMYVALDVCAFIAFVAMIFTELILMYVLPSQNLVGENSSALLWGLTQSDWNIVHLGTLVALMTALTPYFFLHWHWLVGVATKRQKTHSGLRFGLGAIGLVTLFIFAVSPDINTPRPISVDYNSSERGWNAMTLGEVSAQTGIPIQTLLNELKLPADTPPASQLGNLSHEYGFDAQDEINRIVDNYAN